MTSSLSMGVEGMKFRVSTFRFLLVGGLLNSSCIGSAGTHRSLKKTQNFIALMSYSNLLIFSISLMRSTIVRGSVVWPVIQGCSNDCPALILFSACREAVLTKKLHASLIIKIYLKLVHRGGLSEDICIKMLKLLREGCPVIQVLPNGMHLVEHDVEDDAQTPNIHFLMADAYCAT